MKTYGQLAKFSLAILFLSSQISNAASTALATDPRVIAGAYGLGTRFVANYVGSQVADPFVSLIAGDARPEEKGFLRKTTEVIAAVDTSVILWSAGLIAAKQITALKSMNPVAFNHLHQSGMDTVFLLGSVAHAHEWLNAQPEEWSATNLLYQAAAGAAIFYAAQKAYFSAGTAASAYLGKYVTKLNAPMKALFSTLVIYNVGIILTSLATEALKPVADAVGCVGCTEAMQLGDDVGYLAYPGEGVFAGYNKVHADLVEAAIASRKAKTE